MKTLLLLLALLFAFGVRAEMTILPHGGADLDSAKIRVLFFGKGWNGRREQSAAVVRPDAGYPKKTDGGFLFKGTFFTEKESFAFSEEIAKQGEGRYRFRMELSSPGGVESELAACSIKLPAAAFAGRRVKFGEREFKFPETVGKETVAGPVEVASLAFDMPEGRLTLSAPGGKLRVRLQDDRFYAGNSTYDLRISFSPERGLLKRSECAFDLAYTPYRTAAVEFRPGTKTVPVPAAAGDALFVTFGGETAGLRLLYADGSEETREWSADDGIPAGDDRLVKVAPLRAPLRAVEPAGQTDLRKLASGEDRVLCNASEYVLKPGAEWKAFDFQVNVLPGSILDFSDLADAPAGKYGRVTVSGGNFEFEKLPGVPQRFYGANICFTVNYQEKKELETTVLALRRMGYNTLRIHHYDAGLIDPNAPDSVTFDPEKIDRLDYLFHLAKENGLYVAIDLYTLRPTRKGEIASLGGRELRLQEFKMFAVENDEVFENWKAFARNLLTHVNPYTGLAWKDDPALFNLCLVNEDNLNGHWNTTPESRALFRAAFEKAGGGDDAAFNRFLIGRQRDFYRRASEFVRSLGCKVPLTDMNMHHQLPLGLVRNGFDYVDNHIYHDHPRYLGKPGSWPNGFHNESSVARRAEVPRLLFPTRILGKPFAVSEFNFCAPNGFRAESGLLAGCYAALQDYSVMQRFAYSHWPDFVHRPTAMGRFDIATDPVSLLADRMAALIFLKHLVRPARNVIPLLYGDRVLDNPDALIWRKGEAPGCYSELGLVSRLGSVIAEGTPAAELPFAVTLPNAPPPAGWAEKTVPATPGLAARLEAEGRIPAGSADEKRGRFRSDTGELELDAKQGTFRAVSPEMEGFLLTGNSTLRGNVAEVASQSPWNVVMLASRDGKALRDSGRILLMHLTDTGNLNARYADSSRKILLDAGVMPSLVRRGRARLTLDLPGEYEIYAVGTDGARGKRIVPARENGKLVLPLDTFQTMVYELASSNKEMKK